MYVAEKPWGSSWLTGVYNAAACVPALSPGRQPRQAPQAHRYVLDVLTFVSLSVVSRDSEDGPLRDCNFLCIGRIHCHLPPHRMKRFVALSVLGKESYKLQMNIKI